MFIFAKPVFDFGLYCICIWIKIKFVTQCDIPRLYIIEFYKVTGVFISRTGMKRLIDHSYNSMVLLLSLYYRLKLCTIN